MNLGLRYDRQWGAALPSTRPRIRRFPPSCRGSSFAGYDAPFTWNNISPRVGADIRAGRRRKMLVRASFSRYAGQLATGAVGYANPAASAGVAVYGWTDLNGDHLASPNEVNLNRSVAAAMASTAQSDGRYVGERDRSESQGAGHEQLRCGPRSRAASEPGRAGELHVYAGVEPVRQPLREYHAAGRRPGQRRLHAGCWPERDAARRNAVQRATYIPTPRSSRPAAAVSSRRTSRATTPTTTVSRSPSPSG